MMFPDLSGITESGFYQHRRRAELRREAKELVTDIRGSGEWPERAQHEEVIYDLLQWGDTIFR